MGLLLAMPGCEELPSRESEGTLRIYLARHGQTDWNAERRLQGVSDTLLNETGKQQAQALARRLESVELDAIYSSALRRSRETAEALSGKAPLVSLPALNEQSLGKFEGIPMDGKEPELEEEFRRRTADPEDDLDGGESLNQHLARVREALKEIRRKHPSGRILIVGHGGTNVLILRSLLGLAKEQAETVHQANDELYLIELKGERTPGLWKFISPDRLEEL